LDFAEALPSSKESTDCLFNACYKVTVLGSCFNVYIENH